MWSLRHQHFVSVPGTGGQAWDDMVALIVSGRCLGRDLEVREVEHRCDNGHDRDDYDGECPFCSADAVVAEAYQERDAWGEKADALEEQLREAAEEIAGLTTDVRELRAQLRSLTAFPGEE